MAGPVGRHRSSTQSVVPVRRPRPKQLEAPPLLHDVAPPLGVAGALSPGGAGGPASLAVKGTYATDDPAALTISQSKVRDPLMVQEARRIAARIRLERDERKHLRRSASGRLVSGPFDGEIGEVDLDRTIERAGVMESATDDDVVIRDRRRRRCSVVLVVDVSGSMGGPRFRMAAATVGALAARFDEDGIGVVAFWSDAAVLLPLTRRPHVGALLDTLAGLEVGGLTNVGFALEAAGRVGHHSQGERRVILFSDCVHNAGPDPASAARRLQRVDVLVDVSAEHDLDMARSIARAGQGLAIPVRDHRSAAVAVSRCFGGRASTARR